MSRSHTITGLLGSTFQAHPWHGVSPRTDSGQHLHAFIEIVPSDAVKYELDKRTGHLKVDRPQLFSSLCPTLYGFVPQTYCGPRVAERCVERLGINQILGDGDPLDVCVLTEKSVAHGVFVRARAIGGIRVIDGDEADDKIIAILESDLTYGHMKDIDDCPAGILDRLQHYFLSYKQRPDDPRKVRVAEVYDRAEAETVIDRSIEDYVQYFGDPLERVQALKNLFPRPPG